MQFVVIGRDAKDPGALERRMQNRAAHIARCDQLLAEGSQIFGVALLDAQQKMCGSVMIFEFPDRAALDAWMREEPYVTGKVWEQIEVMECRVGPSFERILEKMRQT